MSLAQETLVSSAAGHFDLGQVWMAIVFAYGVSAFALLVTVPLLYVLVRIGWRLDRALGIGSAPPPIAPDAFPAKVAELRRTTVRRGLVIAGVFDAFATLSALIFVIGYGAQDHVSLYEVLLYTGIAVLAAAGCTALWIVPIGVTAYFAERSNLRYRVQHPGALS